MSRIGEVVVGGDHWKRRKMRICAWWWRRRGGHGSATSSVDDGRRRGASFSWPDDTIYVMIAMPNNVKEWEPTRHRIFWPCSFQMVSRS